MNPKLILLGIPISLGIACIFGIQAWFGYLGWVNLYGSIPTLYLTQAEKLAYTYAVDIPSVIAMLIGIVGGFGSIVAYMVKTA
jgi:hypothetical protein